MTNAMPVLNLLAESKLGKLLPDDVPSPLEASGLALIQGTVHVVVDNDCRIAALHPSLKPDSSNRWLGRAGSPRGLVSAKIDGFESLTWDQAEDQLLALVEAAPDPAHRRQFRALIVRFTRDGRALGCHWLSPRFDGDNKGFEGLQWLPAEAGRPPIVLALCEGNRCCGGSAGRKPGGGRIHVFQDAGRDFAKLKVLHLPASIPMEDYSDLCISDSGRMAVVSQSSQLIWIGQFDSRTLQIVDRGCCFRFPTSKQGNTRYAYAEGICWDGDELLVVSDKANRSDRKRIRKRAESIHRFSIP